MVEVNGLCCSVGKREVLQDAGFKVGNGKTYGIWGETGTGKSTVTALLAGAIPIEKGIVRINGFDMEKEGEKARRCIGYMPERLPGYPELTVYEFLDFVAACKQIKDSKRFRSVHQIMEQMDLVELRNTRIAELAPMDLRLLALAQAMLGDPDILILDDPVKDLSEAEEDEIKEHIREYAEKGKTIFLASSSIALLRELSDAILRLENGRLSAPTDPNELDKPDEQKEETV